MDGRLVKQKSASVHQFFLLLPPLFRSFLSHCDLTKGTDAIVRLVMTPPARHLPHLLFTLYQTCERHYKASVLAGGLGGQNSRAKLSLEIS